MIIILLILILLALIGFGSYIFDGLVWSVKALHKLAIIVIVLILLGCIWAALFNLTALNELQSLGAIFVAIVLIVVSHEIKANRTPKAQPVPMTLKQESNRLNAWFKFKDYLAGLTAVILVLSIIIHNI